MGKVIIDIARTLGKAILAGVGLELAKVASDQIRKKLGPKEQKDETPEEENARLKAELAKAREEIDAMRRAHQA